MHAKQKMMRLQKNLKEKLKANNMSNSRSKVQERRHLPLDPKPMYVSNELGRKSLEELGLPVTQKRIKSRLDTRDDTDDE